MGVAGDSDWYDPAIYPEIRSAPPWVMEDMIEAQVMLPEALGDSLASSAPRLVEMLHAAADAGEPIVVSAVGTSGHSARAVALILNDAIGESAVAAGPAEARESADQALAPRRKGLCIAISHGGLSRSTVRALTAAREAGAKTALITAAGGTPARDIADVVLMTPLRDKSYCHTVGYTSPMLTGFYLASAYREEEFPAAGLGRYLRELLTMRPGRLEIGGELGKAERLIAGGKPHRRSDGAGAGPERSPRAPGCRPPCSAWRTRCTATSSRMTRTARWSSSSPAARTPIARLTGRTSC